MSGANLEGHPGFTAVKPRSVIFENIPAHAYVSTRRSRWRFNTFTNYDSGLGADRLRSSRGGTNGSCLPVQRSMAREHSTGRLAGISAEARAL